MGNPIFLTLFVVFQLHAIAAGSLTSTGQTLLLNDIPYYVPATPFTILPFPNALKTLTSAGSLAPVTVVSVSSTNSSLGTLQTIVDEFGSDDVWNNGFLQGKCKYEALHYRHIWSLVVS